LSVIPAYIPPKNGLFFCFVEKTDAMANRTIDMEVIGKAGIHNHIMPDMIDHLMPELIP
jgi:hypothetical protein